MYVMYWKIDVNVLLFCGFCFVWGLCLGYSPSFDCGAAGPSSLHYL